MASTFSPNLRIELIGDGEQYDSWGDTTNVNLGTIIEDAIAGLATVSVVSADQALTAADGVADEARNAILELATSTGADFAVYAPPESKQYTLLCGYDLQLDHTRQYNRCRYRGGNPFGKGYDCLVRWS